MFVCFFYSVISINIQDVNKYNKLVLSLPCPGSGGVRSPGIGDVSVEPAGGPRSIHGVLACLICSSNLLLFQHTRSARLKREASLPLSDKVIN